MDTREKLAVLADDSRYDLSCACGTKKGVDRRQRGEDGMWLYPVSLPRGGTSVLLKTLLSNACDNDCRYCPLRSAGDFRRCAIAPEDLARAFMGYLRQKKVFGLFLSSAVIRDPDYTMDRMIAAVRTLRARYKYRGYVHLKIIPGASDAAIEEAISLATTVSLNVEAPTRAAFRTLTSSKDYDRDIVRPIRLISRLTARGGPHDRVKQTTQFIVGAAGESDADIVDASFGLYKRLGLSRVYFSAYQRGLGEPDLPGERHPPARPQDALTREHRLYQVDWLIRKYGFSAEEIPFGTDGNLSLEADPKQIWAERHPERFPVDINKADKLELLRVPGVGEITAGRILEIRKGGGRIRSISQLGRPGKRLRKAEGYIKFGYKRRRTG
ncbi:MAG: helix-hairpin-helix domain-containing protein [Planctomycetes bacterium]|nr:helix-hairpin-helix domain-containing protein [Planctomycetota bacterium]